MYTPGTPTASRNVPLIARTDIMNVLDPNISWKFDRFVIFGTYFMQLMSFLSLFPIKQERPVNVPQNKVFFFCLALACMIACWI